MGQVSLYTWLLVFGMVFLNTIQAADTDMVSHTVRREKGLSDDQYHQKLVAYWTPERKKAAKPAKPPKPKFNQTIRSQNGLQNLLEAADGPVTVIEGRLPDKNLKESQILSPVNQVTKTVGKVFYSGFDGDYTCSASVITSPSKTLLVTAGHCVYDQEIGYWYFNWYFVPAYDMGDAPLGEWAAKDLYTFQGWVNGGSPTAYNYDVGFVVLLSNNGKRIAQFTGSQGIGFNLPKSQLTFSFGYPGDVAEGEIMSACIARTVSPPCNFGGYIGQGLRCGMGQGSSGGPWIQNFVPSTGLGTITSLNSYFCPDYAPYFMHGPYFNTVVKSIYDQLKNRI